nr:hypothetical protein [Tanacetum cinerariifolium]
NFYYTVTLRIYSPYDLQIIMVNPLPNHVVNLPDDEQVQPEPVPALLGFAPAVLDIPNNNNGWIEEEPEEDPKMEEEEEEEEMDIEDKMDDPKIIDPYKIEKVQPEPVPALLGFAPAVLDIPNNNYGWIEEEPEEDPKMEEEEEEEEEEEMDIEDKMDDPKIIDPYKIEKGKLPPPPADSDTSSDSEPEVEAEDEDEDEAATVGTITCVQPFLGTTYVWSRSSRKVFAPGPIGMDVNILHRKSVSTLEDQMQGLMLEDKEEKERLKKKLRFGVEIPPCMGDGDVTTPDNAHP